MSDDKHDFRAKWRRGREDLSFELVSFLLSPFRAHPPPKNRLLNLGFGKKRHEAYVNADFFPLDFARRLLGRPPRQVDWALDLRRPLRCRDDFFQGIYAEHVLEHLRIADARRLLAELRRVMAPDAVIRIIVPSLEKYAAYYAGEVPHEKFLQWKLPAEAMWNLNHNWGHKCAYDFAFLAEIMREAGFEDIRRCSFGEGADRRLILDSPERAWESLYVEARKSTRSRAK
ncbi:class I SAM-dependent methyltransferase [Afifella pfennigii]|uniref:class I SAM-dependent methyltransferase n=1 Tax=Afifella pfennigii TaxID=209897 RepID=UPI00068ED6B8|nr:methyltransferase domain-containing protein [Afifella pfennigii]